MSCRPHGRKPTIAFWMLVAIADAAMLVVAAGPAVTFAVVAGIVLVASALVAVRRSPRHRTQAAAQMVAQTRALVARRGAMTTEVVARRRA